MIFTILSRVSRTSSMSVTSNAPLIDLLHPLLDKPEKSEVKVEIS